MSICIYIYIYVDVHEAKADAAAIAALLHEADEIFEREISKLNK
jgi:hypothetical protein